METFQGAEYDKQLTLAGWDAAVGLRELIDERATPNNPIFGNRQTRAEGRRSDSTSGKDTRTPRQESAIK
jgi:hypothetical protein